VFSGLIFESVSYAIFMKNRWGKFWIKLKSWEYWPLHLIYTPIYMYWIWLGLRARSLFYFTAANPAIKMGGLYGESKSEILQALPQRLIPKTIYVSPDEGVEAIEKRANAVGIHFPMIAKPDKGERGFKVEKLKDQAELSSYREAVPTQLIVQEFIDYPEEVAVLYYRFPGEKSGKITSITLKEYLSVTGDGTSTVRQLMQAYPRARLQLDTFEAKQPELLSQVPPAGERWELNPIGNHCRGTTFLDGTHLIDDQLLATFDHVSHQLDGIYFGRYDIKCQSFESLRRGENFCILELNGLKSEPTHIYQPGFSIWKAYGILFRQWKTVYKLALANHQLGVPYTRFRDGVRMFFGTVSKVLTA